MTTETNGFKEALSYSDDSLRVFLNRMTQLDSEFCRLMHSGNEFSVRMEVRGNHGVLIHAVVNSYDLMRPKGVDQQLEAVAQS